MKIGTTEKLKFKNLQRRLRLPLWQAVGLLETLWKVACRNAPTGDIGRLCNDEIAGAMEWHGDADELISVLVETKWLDPDPTHRLLIHDWEGECEAWVHSTNKRYKREFAKPTQSEPQQSTQQRSVEPDSTLLCSLPLPLPTLPPLPSPLPITWEAVAGELRKEGVFTADEAVERARRNCTAAEALEVIKQWRAKQPLYSAGLLASKIRNLQPDSRITWPEPTPEAKLAFEQKQAGNAKRLKEATQKAAKQKNANDSGRVKAIDLEFSPNLDEMSKEQLTEFVLLRLPKQIDRIPVELPVPPGLFRQALLSELDFAAKQRLSVLESHCE